MVGGDEEIDEKEALALVIFAGIGGGRCHRNLSSRELRLNREVCRIHVMAHHECLCCGRNSPKGAHTASPDSLLYHRLANVRNIFGVNGRERVGDGGFGRSGVYATHRFPLGSDSSHLENFYLPHH